MTEFDYAKKKYASYGVDVEKALERIDAIPLSVHCWQGDDVLGFEGATTLEGGIQTTGNYPGAAKGFEELKEDIRFAFKRMPGKKRLNLHASYAVLGEDLGKIDRDGYSYRHFLPWVEFAKELGLDGIDFNPTFFSHPKVKDGLTLSSPDEATRSFWVSHGIRSLEIASELGKAFGKPCFVNLWIPDGLKDVPADRFGPRLRLKQSLDEIIDAPSYDRNYVRIGVESKVFGIGVESYTVGSSEFYQNYASKKGILCLMDTGHYHPTETVSDKIPALLCFYDALALHLSRPVRWDSDHVVVLDDELKEVAKEIIRNNAESKTIIGLDYFDASINRLSAWITGERSVRKALLYAALLPNERLKALQDQGRFTELMVLQEEAKLLPFGTVYEEYLSRLGLDEHYLEECLEQEKSVLARRITK